MGFSRIAQGIKRWLTEFKSGKIGIVTVPLWLQGWQRLSNGSFPSVSRRPNRGVGPPGSGPSDNLGQDHLVELALCIEVEASLKVVES